MGEGNSPLGGRLLRGCMGMGPSPMGPGPSPKGHMGLMGPSPMGLMGLMGPQFGRDLSSLFRESILALEQVQQASIILHGKAKARLTLDNNNLIKGKGMCLIVSYGVIWCRICRRL
jgi:hypothetical protein